MIKKLQTDVAALKRQVAALSNTSIEGYNKTQGRGGTTFGKGEREVHLTLARPKTVVIVKEPIASDETLTVREAGYTNIPPKGCIASGTPPITTCYYAWYGVDFEVYPPLGKRAVDFDGDEQVPADDAHPPKVDTKFHRIHREREVWVITPSGEASAVIGQFRIVGFSGFPDSITVKTWDGTNLGSEIHHVAKPFTLRRTRFDGFQWNGIIYSFQSNIERTAIKTIPGNPPTEQTEKQVIVPAYTVNQTIYAAKEVVGGTGTTYDGDDGVPQDVKWLDLNVDGRQWAKKA
jgi:hypothetical protein